MSSPLSDYLIHRIEDKLLSLGEHLLLGGAESYMDYCQVCGEAKGLKEILMMIEDVRQKDEDDIESFMEH